MVHEWVGVPFQVVSHHDGRLIRSPGLYGFSRREADGQPSLLFLDHADCIAEQAVVGHPCWADALSLGMNELHICLKAKTRIDRRQLRARIVLRVGPLLNVLRDAKLSGEADPQIDPALRLRA